MKKQDLMRELEKIEDVVGAANTHFQAEAKMNAALHLSENVRPAPLAAAIAVASESLATLLETLNGEGVS